MLHQRSNITASFVERIKFQEKLNFADALSVNRGKFEYYYIVVKIKRMCI